MPPSGLPSFRERREASDESCAVVASGSEKRDHPQANGRTALSSRRPAAGIADNDPRVAAMRDTQHEVGARTPDEHTFVILSGEGGGNVEVVPRGGAVA